MSIPLPKISQLQEFCIYRMPIYLYEIKTFILQGQSPAVKTEEEIALGISVKSLVLAVANILVVKRNIDYYYNIDSIFASIF